MLSTEYRPLSMFWNPPAAKLPVNSVPYAWVELMFAHAIVSLRLESHAPSVATLFVSVSG